jgi:hypothetical protein
MNTAATLILLTLSTICLATGERVQGCMFLAVMWVCSVIARIRKEDEDGKTRSKL